MSKKTVKTAADTVNTIETVAAEKPAKPARKCAAKPAAQFIDIIGAALKARQAFIVNNLDAKAVNSQGGIMKRCIDMWAVDSIAQKAQAQFPKTDFANLESFICGKKPGEENKFLEQVKSIEKVIKLITCMTADKHADLDEYQRYSMLALLSNDNTATVSEMVIALSKKANESRDQLKVRDSFKSLTNYTPGTATSQTGQVRQVFNAMGFFVEGTFHKGKKDDKPVLNEYGIAQLQRIVYGKTVQQG